MNHDFLRQKRLAFRVRCHLADDNASNYARASEAELQQNVRNILGVAVTLVVGRNVYDMTLLFFWGSNSFILFYFILL